MRVKAASRQAYRLIHEGAVALAQIEANGIRIDTGFLDSEIDRIGKEVKDKEKELLSSRLYKKEWVKAFGDKAKLGSREQLAHLVFEILNYPCKERTKPTKKHPEGRPKADSAAFEDVDLPFVKDYLQVEKLKKVRNTFLMGIKKETCNGYLHPFFNLHTALSFRSSSDSPNFQNFPIRNEEMARIVRSCVIPPKGYRVAEHDFGGIEVKVAACYHKDPAMLKYIKDKTTDMHRDMAAECYLLDQKDVNKRSRHCAKNMFVFPQFYGSFYVDCAKALWDAISQMHLTVGDTKVGLKEHLAKKGIKERGKCDPDQSPKPGTFEHHLQKVEKDFWGRRFPVYDRWKKDWWAKFQATGFLEMLTGFVVSGVGNLRKNQVINLPVQGSAFHCLLWCLTKIQKWLVKNRMKTRIVGQIHDSQVSYVHPKEEQEFLAKCYEVMTVDLPAAWDWIIVPMEVEAELAPTNLSWHNKAVWEESDGVWAPKNKAA